MHQEPIEQTFTHVLEEARMLLPGIQALFGFQLIAVFNESFHQRLPAGLRVLHLIATALTSVAVGVVMTPAAYHRLAEPRTISERMVRISSRLLSFALAPLALAIACEIFIIAALIAGPVVAAALGGALLLALLCLWFFWPLGSR
jgi:hypothetical protein